VPPSPTQKPRSRSHDIDWSAVRAEVLSRIDPLAELERLGLKRAANARPSPRGWIAVHSPYAKDARASAGLFVGNGPGRGVLVDLSGGGKRKKSFWQVFVDLGGAHDYYDALKLFARRTGVRLGNESELSESDADAYHAALMETNAHLRLLDERGVKPETATAYKLGWDPKRSYWIIPNRDRDGALINLKLHPATGSGKRPKSAHSGPPRVFGAELLAKAPAGSTIIITEGEFDAIMTTQETGLIAVSSSNGCKSFQPEFVADFRGHHVVLCYDADAEGRHGAACVAELFRKALQAGEVLSLRSCRLYPTENKDRKDVSDFIHKDKRTGVELRAVLEGAPVVTFADQTTESAVDSGAKAVNCDAIAHREKAQTIVPGDKPVVICNFWLEITEETRVEHANGESELLMRCAMRSAAWERRFEIEAGEFHDNRSLKKALGRAAGKLAVIPDERAISLIRAAGQQASESTICRRQVESFGILRSQKVPTYVSPDVVVRAGQIIPTAESGLHVRLPDHHKACGRLNLTSAPAEEARTILNDLLLDFFGLYTVPLGGAVLASVALAVAQDMDEVAKALDSRVAVWIVGPSGSGKTELALMAMRFFGPFTKNDIPSWSDTANNLEMELASCNSAVAVADDWKADLLNGGAMERAKRVLQSYAQGRARHRLNSASKFVYTPPIRAQLLVTGEDAPQGAASIKARGLWFDARKIVKDASTYFRIREASLRFPAVTPHLIAWIQQQGTASIIDRFSHSSLALERSAAERGIRDDNMHRLAYNLALLTTGLDLMLDFATSLGAWDSELAADTKTRFFNAMVISLTDQAETIRSDNPAEIFVETLRSLLASGGARLVPLTRPVFDDGSDAAARVDDRPSIPVVGYVQDAAEGSQACVLLLPKAAVAAVNDQLRREHGERLAFSAKAISQGLEAMGFLVTGSAQNGENSAVTRVNGQRLRVWKLKSDALSGNLQEENNGDHI